MITTTQLKYGIASVITGVVITGTFFYFDGRRQINSVDMIEILQGTIERTLAIRTNNPLGAIPIPAILDSFVEWNYSSTGSSYTLYTFTNTIGNQIYKIKSDVTKLDQYIKQCIPGYINTNRTTNAFIYLTVQEVFSNLNIGDCTSEFTRIPALGTNPAVYTGPYPAQIYTNTFIEMYRVLNYLKFLPLYVGVSGIYAYVTWTNTDSYVLGKYGTDSSIFDTWNNVLTEAQIYYLTNSVSLGSSYSPQCISIIQGDVNSNGVQRATFSRTWGYPRFRMPLGCVTDFIGTIHFYLFSYPPFGAWAAGTNDVFDDNSDPYISGSYSNWTIFESISLSQLSTNANEYYYVSPIVIGDSSLAMPNFTTPTNRQYAIARGYHANIAVACEPNFSYCTNVIP